MGKLYLLNQNPAIVLIIFRSLVRILVCTVHAGFNYLMINRMVYNTSDTSWINLWLHVFSEKMDPSKFMQLTMALGKVLRKPFPNRLRVAVQLNRFNSKLMMVYSNPTFICPAVLVVWIGCCVLNITQLILLEVTNHK